MTKAEKTAVIEELKEKFENSSFFYVTDSSTLSVEKVNNLRSKLFEHGIEVSVVKNTLTVKALQSPGFFIIILYSNFSENFVYKNEKY